MRIADMMAPLGMLLFLIEGSSSMPVIAIYSYYHLEGGVFDEKRTEIWGGYVRWLEQGGAEVVAIHHWHSHAELDAIMKRVNGILFTGVFRVVNLTDIYEATASYLIDKAIELNKRSDYFPIWGTCFSSELFLCKAINSEKIISSVSSMKLFEESFLVPKAYSARMFSNFHYKDYQLITKHNSTFQFHQKAIRVDDYETHIQLLKFFHLTGIGKNKDGIAYVNSFEAKHYPIYGILYHAEVVPYARAEGYNFDHSNEAIKLSQLHALFFVNEARKSSHSFPQSEREKYHFISSYKHSAKYDFSNNYYNFRKSDE